MPITVVTTRGDEGAPSSRDVYASGARYAIGNSNLEIFSAKAQLLALYPSGNWLSVYVDDSVQVNPPGPVDREGEEDVGSDGTAVDAAVADEFADTDTGSIDTDIDLDMDADVDTDVDTDVGVDADLDTDIDEPPPAERRVRILPPRARPSTSRPAHLLPVRFAPKLLQADRPAAEEPAEHRMLPISFAPKVLRAPPREDKPARSRMQPLTFRMKPYRTTSEQDGRPDDGGQSEQSDGRAEQDTDSSE